MLSFTPEGGTAISSADGVALADLLVTPILRKQRWPPSSCWKADDNKAWRRSIHERRTYRRAITLTSGKVALIQGDKHFTLVPWRAILEGHRGRHVVGVARGMGVARPLGIERDRGLSRRALQPKLDGPSTSKAETVTPLTLRGRRSLWLATM